MSGIVLELQAEALEKDVSTSDLLRKAFVVAKKLKVTNLESWIKNELEGYEGVKGEDIPTYRKIRGTPEVLNPFHGWQPIMFQDKESAETASITLCKQSIFEIEHLLGLDKGNGRYEIAYSGELAQQIMAALDTDLRPALRIQSSSLAKISNNVRNIILQWALKLEEDNILGNGISFSKSEVEAAAQSEYTINLFLGNVVNSQIQQKTHSSSQNLNMG